MLKTISLAAASLVLFACGSPSNNNFYPSTDLAAANGDLGAAAGDLAMGGDYYLPAGYTLVPFLSPTAVHSFTQADMVLDPAKDYRAVIETDAGRIVLELLATDAPIAVNSFVFLTLHHYFDGIAFHRVIDNFMAQTGDPNTLGGDPSTWGTGGPGYFFSNEIVNSLTFNGAGVVGMANTGQPDSNGSQFFITFVAYPSLNGMYTIFANVNEGLTVLPVIKRGQPPATPTRMTRVYIVAK